MEKFQGPILHPSLHLFDGHLGVGCSLEEEIGIHNNVYGEFMNYRFEDPHCTIFPSLEDKMPFLQMLQGVVAYSQPPPLPPPPPETDTPSFNLTQQPNFQLLLRLQQEKLINMKSCFANELQSCVTNNNDVKISPSEIDGRKKGGRSGKKMGHLSKLMSNSDDVLLREDGSRKKRKRGARPSKNKEQVESQRMTHIAVERNRRRQMNEHLNALRSLMPPSYIQRGDQASIIGGAIDFVKELEQLLQSLQAQKRMRQTEDNLQPNVDVSANTSTSTSSSSNLLSSMFMGLSSSSSSSPSSSTLQLRNPENALQEDQTLLCAENKSSIGDIEVVVIQNHVNMKIQCRRRPGQLIKAIVGLEDLRLSVLHLNITSFRDLVLYSFNLKIEDDCKLGSADEVATAVHQIFSFINITNL